MRRRGKGRPEAVGSLVTQVLGELGLEASLRVVRVAQRWEEAVGAEIAAHCRPAALRGGVLEAEVDSSVWCQELQLRRPEILAGLRRVFGDEAPSDVWLRLGT